ncbi:hypothetical protein M8C21_009458 [Ambrosia artemisiifolia]|uniref:Transmembrane Fragile-X-F-associated protein n=1 Tax=Ambrosia artemisiifolia TaxID=4212 RepID=A0AAD5G5L6_AMBAR|nr:hypothetical protein M8C21_009458 [Ambrosia artemisiifolia]
MKVPAVSLKIVFLPLLAFEITILVDNVRMCKALLPVNEEHLTDEAIWETLPHFWICISMIFFIAATLFTLLKLCGDIGALGWWDLFINFGIAECFAFLVCKKWSNPAIHRNHQSHYATSSSDIRYPYWNSDLLDSSNNIPEDRIHRLQYLGGHITKVPIIVFQILLCMHLERKPGAASFISLPIVFSPLLVLQGTGVVFSATKLVDEYINLLNTGPQTRQRSLDFSAEAHDCFGFLYGGSRLLGWWSIDEESREEQARLYHAGASG